MAGRNRKPVEQHKAAGTFRADRHNEPIEPTGEPRKPSWLKGEALGYWKEIVAALPPGILARSDSYTIAGAARWFAEWQKYDAQLEAADGEPYKIIMLATMSWKNFEKAAAKLGLTPVDRARLRVEHKPEAADEKQRFVSRIVG